MNQWDSFDQELADSLADLPPSQETAEAVTPWREAIRHIVLGLCLTCFTLNLWYFPYLLPAVGALQAYLGLRVLRENNRWFRIAMVLSICKVLLLYINLILAATPLWLWSPLLPAGLSAALTLSLLFTFRQALRAAARSMNRSPRRDPMLAALAWYLLLILLARFLPEIGWIGGIALTAAFVLIIRSLLRVSKELEDWGYGVHSAPVKVSEGRLKAWYYGSLLALILLSALFFSHHSLSWTPAPFNRTAETAALQTQLADLGLPEAYSARLLPEDLATLADAVSCDAGIEEVPLGTDHQNIRQNAFFALSFPDGTVRVVHFFTPGDEGGFWQCGLRIQSNAAVSDVTCRLFFAKDQQRLSTCLAAKEPLYQTGATFFGMPFSEYTVSTAPFSWPFDARDRAAYVLFTADQPGNPETVLSYSLDCCESPLPQYPYTPEPTSVVWSTGKRFYFGDGSSLMYKADEIASAGGF